MTAEEKQEIIATIRDAVRAEIVAQLEKQEMMKTMRNLYNRLESQRPFTCADLKCKNRKFCKR